MERCTQHNKKHVESSSTDDTPSVTSIASEVQEEKNLDQYFTTSEYLKDCVFRLVKYKTECLLEPSFGAGHLLSKFLQLDLDYPMNCYEIDNNIAPIVQFNDKQNVKICNF